MTTENEEKNKVTFSLPADQMAFLAALAMRRNVTIDELVEKILSAAIPKLDVSES